MKRSEINNSIREARRSFESIGFQLPPFANYSPAKWRDVMNDPIQREIHKGIWEAGLGWDVTDFGSGDYSSLGLLLFTLRNGRPNQPRSYAEKIMLVGEGQVTPWHFHWQKAEDIINRGGGVLVLEVHLPGANDVLEPGQEFVAGEFNETEEVSMMVDGSLRTVPAGGKIELHPGESVALLPRVYHTFYGKIGEGTVVVGEVSCANDDIGDNRFYRTLPRFATVEEDEAAQVVLVNEYLGL